MPRYTQGGAAQDGSKPEPELRHRSETSQDFQQGHDDVAAPLSEAQAQAEDALNRARSALGDGLQTASETYDDTTTSVSSTYTSSTAALDDNLQHASNLVDESLQQTADVVKMGAAWTMAISGWASDRSHVSLCRSQVTAAGQHALPDPQQPNNCLLHASHVAVTSL